MTKSKGMEKAMWQGWGHLSRLRSDISGATAVEYGLLAGLIAVGLMGGIGALSDLVNLLFEFVADETATVADGISDSG